MKKLLDQYIKVILIFVLILTNQIVFASDFETLIDQSYGSQTHTGKRAWRKPNFSGQNQSLGYFNKVFEPPKGMEKQVQFWVDIYSKYSSSQGVIHDSENLEIVYGVVDFKDIDENPMISKFKKEKFRQLKVDEFKKNIIAKLKFFSELESPSGLNAEDMKLWMNFAGKSKQALIEAANTNRVRFQLGQKDKFQMGIYFSGRYLEEMEEIFLNEGLPIELTRMVFVESSFNVLARSKVGASGLWQIMPSTAKPFKIMSPAIDKRNHPIESTKVAAKILKYNYKLLESWPLAITGYNHGPAGVKRMTQKYNTRNIAELVKNVQSSVTFGFASRNFFACFLAALEVEKNADKYFGNAIWSKKLEAESLKLTREVDYNEFLKWFDGDTKKLSVFNPHLNSSIRKNSMPIPNRTSVVVPKESYAQVLVDLAKTNSKKSKQAQTVRKRIVYNKNSKSATDEKYD